jgi:hypothetical protein
MPNPAPYCIVALLLIVCLAFTIYSHKRAIRLSERGWEDLLSRVQAVNTKGLTTIALDYLNPTKSQTAIQPRELWKLVGAYEGLRHMRVNVHLMLALAAHASQWDYEEATIVTERMRRDALRLRRALLKIEIGFVPIAFLRRFYFTAPFHIQEAAAAYYLMRQRLLTLYASAHAGRYPALAAVL